MDPVEFETLLQELQGLSPEERQKRLADLGIAKTPARVAVTPATGPVGAPTGAGISPEGMAEIQQMISIAGKSGQPMSAFSDAELQDMIGGGNAKATKEAEVRQQIDEQGIGRMLNPAYLDRLIRQSGSGLHQAFGSDPIGLAGLAASGAEWATGTDLGADSLINISQDLREKIQGEFGISEPRGPAESLVEIAGGAAIPVGKKPPTGLVGNMLEVATPLAIGGGKGRIAANIGVGFGLDQAVRELADDDGSTYQTIFDRLRGADSEDNAYPEAARALITGLGVFAGASVVTPAVVNTLKKAKINTNQPPKVKKVSDLDMNAPQKLETLEKASDLYKTYAVDEKSALTDIAERAGMPDLGEVRSRIDQDTQISGLMRVNESLHTGKLRTATGNFDSTVSPQQLYRNYRSLPVNKQKDIDRYLKLLDMTDDLRIRIAKNIKVTDSQQMLAQANAQIQQLLARTPEAAELSRQYAEVTKAVRNFLSEGPNAMLSRKGIAYLNQNRQNYVPADVHQVNAADNLISRMVDAQRAGEPGRGDAWFLQKRDLEHIIDIDKRVDSFDALIDYTRSALRRKMENDVRGLYVDKMLQSLYGSKTVRRKTKAEIDKYGDRTVEFYKNGKKQKFLSSRLQGDLLKFDPYIAKYTYLYAPKRLFELGTTGSLGLTFAPMTLMRDAITGKVLSSKGGTTGLVASAAEVPKQLASKFARGASEILSQGLDSLEMFGISKQQQQVLGTMLANKYANSMLAAANRVGGIDASLMRTNVEIRRGPWRELATAINDNLGSLPGVTAAGHSVRAVAHGFTELFGAIQDAPRAAWFRDAVEKGMSPEEAAVQARKITGDTSRSGRVYSPTGARLDADAVNKEMLFGANRVGAGIELARESIPYVNPTVQGLRRLATRLVEDPVQTNLNAWKYVGLPAFAAYAWNEMLGQEYNDFAFQNRSDYDQAMSIYIAIPGQDPRYGIEFPIGHEMTPWMGVFPQALYSLGKGDRSVASSLRDSGLTILENAGMIGFPTVIGQSMAASGINPPDSILNPTKGVYQYREDNVGLLPENAEKLARQVFGGVTDLALHSAAAAFEGGPEAFAEELAHQWTKKIPIAKNLTGKKTAVSGFTPLGTDKYEKLDSYYRFEDLWDEHFNEEKGRRFYKSALTSIKREGQDTDVPTERVAPLATLEPTNPVYPIFGQMIKDRLGTNEVGMSGVSQRYSLMTKQLQLLKAYNAGKAGAFKEYQDSYKGKMNEYLAEKEKLEANTDLNKREKARALKNLDKSLGETAKVEALYEKLDVDLGTREGVQDMINYIETERLRMATEQLKIIEELEDEMTIELRKQGMLGPNQKFDITRHLSPQALTPPSAYQGSAR